MMDLSKVMDHLKQQIILSGLLSFVFSLKDVCTLHSFSPSFGRTFCILTKHENMLFLHIFAMVICTNSIERSFLIDECN